MKRPTPPSLRSLLPTSADGGMTKPTASASDPVSSTTEKDTKPPTTIPSSTENGADTDPPTAASQPPTTKTTKSALIIAVANERLATLIGPKIHAWLVPGGQDIEVHVIASEEELEVQKVASLLMQLGYNREDVNEAFPNITLGWPDDRPDSP